MMPFPNGSSESWSDIVPAVSVPVLSLQITSRLPRFSIEARCFTITFFFDIATAPRDSVTAVIIGKNSGVSPTASATAKSKDCNGSRWRAMLTMSQKQDQEEDGSCQETTEVS